MNKSYWSKAKLPAGFVWDEDRGAVVYKPQGIAANTLPAMMYISVPSPALIKNRIADLKKSYVSPSTVDN